MDYDEEIATRIFKNHNLDDPKIKDLFERVKYLMPKNMKSISGGTCFSSRCSQCSFMPEYIKDIVPVYEGQDANNKK